MGLARSTVPYTRALQSSQEVVGVWKKDFLKCKPARNLLRLQTEGTETKLRHSSSLQFSWDKIIQ